MSDNYPTITIRIPKETREWLFVESERQLRSMAQIIKDALDQYRQDPSGSRHS